MTLGTTSLLCKPRDSGAHIQPEQTINTGNHLGRRAAGGWLRERVTVPNPDGEGVTSRNDTPNVVHLYQLAPGAKVDYEECARVRARSSIDEQKFTANAQKVIRILIPPYVVARQAIGIAAAGLGWANKEIRADLHDAALDHDVLRVMITNDARNRAVWCDVVKRIGLAQQRGHTHE